MLRVAVGLATLAVTFVTMSPTYADENFTCPPGTAPSGSGLICIEVTDPGEAPREGTPAAYEEPAPAGCHRGGDEVPCQSDLGAWFSGSQCYGAPSNLPPDHPAWGGNSDGSVWECTWCDVGAGAALCNVQLLWLPPGAAPAPVDPGELAQSAMGQLQLATAQVHTAPQAPLTTIIGVDTWMWVPESQWRALTKTVTAGATSVTVVAVPERVVWDMGPESQICYSPGREWRNGMTDAAETTCSYTYAETSKFQADGVFALSAAITYDATWTCSGVCSSPSGSLGLIEAPAGTGVLEVVQRQVVNG